MATVCFSVAESASVGATEAVKSREILSLTVSPTDGCGDKLGWNVGCGFGPGLGAGDGSAVGSSVGAPVGSIVGVPVGSIVGVLVGSPVGFFVGPGVVGRRLGSAVACAVGSGRQSLLLMEPEEPLHVPAGQLVQ